MKKLTVKEKATITKLRLDGDDWYLIIHSERDGYVLETNEGELIPIKNDNEIEANEDLLWEIIYYFNMRSSRHEKEVLSIIREIGEKYYLQPGEKIVKKYYETVGKFKEKT